jgi:hypothetical protein
MIRKFIIIFLLFLLFEGFYLLPENLVVLIPGKFRLIDGIFLIIPVFFIFLAIDGFQSFRRYNVESKLVVAASALVLLNPLMSLFFFGQPYITGLLLIRHNLSYLLFFIFVLCLPPADGLDRFRRLMTILIGIYVIILFVNHYFPSLDLIHLREGLSENDSRMVRSGETRLFLPYADFIILFLCFNLANQIHAPETAGPLNKALELGFIVLVGYAILSTLTRMLIFSLTFVFVFALFSSGRSKLKFLATFIALMLIIAKLLAMGGMEGLSFFRNTKLETVAEQTAKLGEEQGRIWQTLVSMQNFIKSPLTGVGTIVNERHEFEDKSIIRTYLKYGFFNAVDTGYPKIAAEFGLAGLAWLIWYFTYLYRGSREIIEEHSGQLGKPQLRAVAWGIRYFLVYLIISSITFAHFVTRDGVSTIVLTLAIMAIARESQRNKTLPFKEETGDMLFSGEG